MRENFLFVCLGNGEGQGNLACCGPWGHKELDTTEQLNNNNKILSGNSIDQERKKCHIPKPERKNMPAKLSFTCEGKILSQTNKS